MDPLDHIRDTERAALLASLRRYAVGTPSSTQDERIADQLAFIRGLAKYDHTAQRWAPTRLGRWWLDMVAIFGSDDVRATLSEAS